MFLSFLYFLLHNSDIYVDVFVQHKGDYVNCYVSSVLLICLLIAIIVNEFEMRVPGSV